MGAVIWQKTTTCNTTGGASIMGSYPYPRNGILKLDYEFILLFKKLGATKPASREIKAESEMTKDEWKEYFNGHWNFPGERQDKHLAMFPEELPKRLIKMFSFKGETILDPFLGSGTTSLAAKNLDRSSVGYEINEDFIPVIKQRLGCESGELLSNSYRIIKDNLQIDYDKEIEEFPYIFRDPIKFDKKIDVKKMQFGSKIDNSQSKREEYYSVKQILSPEILLLNNDVKVRLLGVKEDQSKKEDANKFLKDKFKGQKVFMKFDVEKYDKDNNLLCYLYLKNKTFINAHLIKHKLVKVSSDYNYRYLSKFRKLEENNG